MTKITKRKSTLTAITAIIAIITAIVIGSIYGLTPSSAVQPTVFGAVQGNGPFVKVDNLAVVESVSINLSVTLSAEQQGFGVAFYANNKANADTVVEVSKWEVSIGTSNGNVLSTETVVTNTKGVVPSSGRVLLHRLDLAENARHLEVWPGSYIVELKGISEGPHQIEKCGAVSCATVIVGQATVYDVKAQVSIVYDNVKIKQSLGVLSADEMKVGVQGAGSPFVLKNGESKTLTFYIVNDQKVKVSALNNFAIEGFWHVDNRSEVVGYNTYIDYDPSTCEFLNPGEMKSIENYKLAYDDWPVGGEGLAKKVGNGNVVPGLYIAAYEVTTLSCTTSDGSEILGNTYNLLIAFEVAP